MVEKTRQSIVANYLGDGDIVEQALTLVGKMNNGERQRFDAAYALRFCDATLKLIAADAARSPRQRKSPPV
jgi:hypothetical protein